MDFIISDVMLQAGDSHSLNRLYNEIVGKDWFMALLDLRSYIETKGKGSQIMTTDMCGPEKCSLILQMPDFSHQTEQFNSTMKIYGIFNITK